MYTVARAGGTAICEEVTGGGFCDEGARRSRAGWNGNRKRGEAEPRTERQTWTQRQETEETGGCGRGTDDWGGGGHD
jgi:hypothetical protein